MALAAEAQRRDGSSIPVETYLLANKMKLRPLSH